MTDKKTSFPPENRPGSTSSGGPLDKIPRAENSDDASRAELRRQAEKRLPRELDTLVAEKLRQGDILTLVHELCTHQIELEMQNEELRSAQRDLEESRRRYVELYDFAPVGYFTTTTQGEIVSVNLTGAAMLSVPRGELLGRSFFLFLHKEDRDDYYLHCLKTAREEAGQSCELRLQRNGEETCIHARLESLAVRDGNGEVLEIMTAVSDVTARRLAEDGRHLSEVRFRRMAEASADIIFQIDTRGEIIYCSPAVRAYGYKPEEVMGQSYRKFVAEADVGRALEALQRLSQGERLDLFEIGMLRANGVVADLEISAVPVMQEGAVVAVQGIARDITVRKLAERDINKLNRELRDSVLQLAAVNMELEAFGSSVSNDLRAPLRSVDGFSRALLEDYGDKLDGAGRDYLQRIVKGAERMGSSIDDLLNLSRVTISTMQRDRVNLSRLAERSADGLGRSRPERRVEFRISPEVFAEGDAHLLRILLDHLLGNAFKFTANRAEAVIEFGVGEEKGKKVYFVKDNGAGLDMKYAAKLFKPFQRLHSEEEFPGSGIGLAMVKRIVNRHGGMVRIEGEREKGTTVWFTLQ